MDVLLDNCTNFGRLYWLFVDVPPLRLMHIGKREVLGLIELMEGRFDERFMFDPQAFGLEGGVSSNVDPQQQYGIRGKVPKAPSAKLKDTRSLQADELGFEKDFKMRSTENYLKANSEDPAHPLTLFRVSGCLHTIRQKHWTLVHKLDVDTVNR